MKKLVVIALLLTTASAAFAENFRNPFTIQKQETNAAYQQYVGKTAVFYKPVNEDEEQFKLRKIVFDVPYTIQSIVLEGEDITMMVLQNDAPKAKPVKITCKNKGSSTYSRYAGIEDIPLYLVEDFEAGRTQYIGKTLTRNGDKVKVIDLGWTNEYISYVGNLKTVTLIYESLTNGAKSEEKLYEALGGKYYSSLSRVEKPADESVRYGETSTIDEEGITKYSYVDNIIDIIIFGTSQEFSFVLKNISDNSIKLVWNEAVFVGLDGTTSKVMHQGIKYSQKDGDQPASVVIRGAKLSDVAVPTENVRYSSILKEWVTDSMYPRNRGNDGQVSLMLPIQIKETINEYIFVFDVKYEWKHPELHEDL